MRKLMVALVAAAGAVVAVALWKRRAAAPAASWAESVATFSEPEPEPEPEPAPVAEPVAEEPAPAKPKRAPRKRPAAEA